MRAAKVIAVVQPHRYSRLASPVRGVLHLLQRRRHGDRRRRLCGRRGADRGRRSRRAGRGPARARPSPASCRCRSPPHWPRWCPQSRRPGDFVVCLGAGNITNGPRRCRAQLAELQAAQPRRAGGAHDGRPRASAASDRIAAARARAHPRRRAAGADDLVPRRRAGRGAVPAGGCRRPGARSWPPALPTFR